ncbi:RDD family protein [Pseudomonas sp. EL_65y_Pfl2_R96]|uniref:RDD family protein n=1 Tax=Pseudomonas sp. EL_65y_Pfl2_R96 TaxID=3088699 RepID=UPI0030D77FA6
MNPENPTDLGNTMDAKSNSKKPKILASVSRRFIAKVIDCVIAVLIFFIVKVTADTLSAYITGITPSVQIVSAGLIAFAYVLFADALPNGQSLGKRLLSIAAVDRKTFLGCTVSQSFTRNAGALIIIDWVWIFLESRTRLGDMHAKTIVIQTGTLSHKVRSLSDVYDGGQS